MAAKCFLKSLAVFSYFKASCYRRRTKLNLTDCNCKKKKEKDTRRHLNQTSKYLNNIAEQIIVLLRNGILPKLPPNKYTFILMINRKYQYRYFHCKKRIVSSKSFKIRFVDPLELELLTLVMGVLIQIILDVFQLLSTF